MGALLARLRARGRRDEGGFTLIEMLVVVVILGVIVGAIANVFLVSFRTTGATDDRIAQSHDAQLLSFWILTDLQSTTQSAITTSTTAATGCSGSPSDANNVLRLGWTDLTSNTTYAADYRAEQVSGTWTLERYYCVAGQAPSSFAVVHNLASPTSAAAAVTGSTVTVSVTTNTAGNRPFTFSVTGKSRVDPGTAATSLGARSQDTNGDGQVDQVIVSYNRALTNCSAPCTGDWTVAGQPGTAGSVHPTAVTVNPANATQVLLTLAETGTVDTAAASMTVTGAADPNGIETIGGKTVSLATTPVADGMAPVLTSTPVSKDTNGDGKLDEIDLAFSEPIATTTFTSAPWTLAHAPAGATVGTATASGATLKLAITGATAVDTVAAGMTLALAASDGGVIDAAGNQSSFPAVTVSDGMAPAVTGTATAADAAGDLNRIDVTFSEPVATGSFSASPWRLTGASGTATIGTPSLKAGTNNTVRLPVSGTTPNTSTAGITLSLTGSPTGVSDSAGNMTSFSGLALADTMPPVAVSAVAKSPTSGHLSEIDVTFSEPITTGTFTAAPWSLSGAPGATIGVPFLQSAGGSTVVLPVSGTAVNTSVSGVALSLNASSNGAVDAAGNQASFAGMGLTDRMPPVLTTFAAANGTAGTAGTVDATDQLTLGWSEPVPMPSSLTLTVTTASSGGGSTTFAFTSGASAVMTVTMATSSYLSGGGSASETCTLLSASSGPATSFTYTVSACTFPHGSAGTGSAATGTVAPGTVVADPAGNRWSQAATLPSEVLF